MVWALYFLLGKKMKMLLHKFFKSSNKNEKQVEIIYISSDLDEEGFDSSIKKMPWKAIPYTNNIIRTRLIEFAQVTEIPRICLLDSNGNMKESNVKLPVELSP